MTDINESEIADVIMSNVDDLLNGIPEDAIRNFVNIARAVNTICLWVRDAKKELNAKEDS